MGSVFFDDARNDDVQAEHFKQPLTTLEVGSEIHVSGKLAPSAKRLSLLSKKECVASLVVVWLSTYYTDTNGTPHSELVLSLDHYDGPENIDILVENQHLALPLRAWKSVNFTTGTISTLDDSLFPPEFRPTAAEEALAEQKVNASGHSGARLTRSIYELVLTPEMPVFVAGRIGSRADSGALLLQPDPFAKRVVFAPGSQAQFVQNLSGSGLRITGWIFLMLNALPLLIGGIVWLRLKRRAN